MAYAGPVGRYLGIGRVAGIPVRLHLSWFAAVPLFTFASLDLWAPDATGLGAALLSLTFSLVFFGSVLAHELCHALAARALGVHTADVSLYVFGGAARITSEPADPGGEVLMAAAGPLGSVLLAGLAGVAAQLLEGPAGELAWLLAAANITLALFNLLPGFPLDGGRIARAAVWRWTGRRVLATRVTAWIGRGLALLLAGGGAAATVLAHAPRYLIQVALGLVLYRASVEGERAARGAAVD
jgi:Zn-dependent protease